MSEAAHDLRVDFITETWPPEINGVARTLEALATGLRQRGFQRLALLGRGVDTELFRPERRSDKLRAEWGAVATEFEDRLRAVTNRTDGRAA